jgi:release factor glutamine methyltransferase
VPLDAARLTALLEASGCVAAAEEAAELLRAADGDGQRLGAMVARRLGGEPLAWVCGSIEVAGLRLHVDPGVYVPRRWQTPAVAERAALGLVPGGTAVDLCTGAGTVASLLQRAEPGARVLGTDRDAVAVRCARRNGVEALLGDLFEPLPAALAGTVDVVVAVAPYVPTRALPLLPKETLAHEPAGALDGGPDGLAAIRRLVVDAPRWLRPAGWLVLEHGPDQASAVRDLLGAAGFGDVADVTDPEGACCGTSARPG